MTLTRKHQLELDFKNTDQPAFDVYKFPLLLKWVSQLMPELLDNSKQSLSLLEAIFHFLFKQKQKQKSRYLEQELNEELYYCLIGLKSTLVDHHHSWIKTEAFLNKHQKTTAFRPLEMAV